MASHQRQTPILAVVLLACTATAFVSQTAAADRQQLAVEQAVLAEKFGRLEALALRIAELIEPDNPDRAQQLRAAVEQSRTLALSERFQEIVWLLESERLAAADQGQRQLAEQLGELMRVLLTDPSEARAEAERKRLENLAKELSRLIKEQRVLRDRLFDGDSGERLADNQRSLAERVERLRDETRNEPSNGDKPPGDRPSGNSKPNGERQSDAEDNPATDSPQTPSGDSQQDAKPTERAGQQLNEARQSMQRAADALGEQQTKQAGEEQTDAQKRLEQAKREIEAALEQLREEEQLRRLTRLAARFDRMRAEQEELNKRTIATAEGAPTPPDRSTQLAANEIAEGERSLSRLADAALRLLREDGRSIAFPAMVEQVRFDLGRVATRLAETRVGSATQRLQQDILDQLEEAVEAFEQAAADQENKLQQQQQGGAAPQGSGESSLVKRIAELRMLRSLQARLLRRTAMWDELATDSQASPEEVRQALLQLADRQARLVRGAAELGKNDTN